MKGGRLCKICREIGENNSLSPVTGSKEAVEPEYKGLHAHKDVHHLTIKKRGGPWPESGR